MSMIVFILELPWELGIPDDYVVEVGSSQREQLRFRTVAVRTQLPLAASDLAFGALQDGEVDDLERKQREDRRLELTKSPYILRRTVVAAYVPSEHDPPRFEAESLSGGLSLALKNLNSWLISLGILYDDRLRPIAAGDLPEVIPVMPAAIVEGELRHGPGQLFGLHEGSGNIREYGADELEQAESMLAIVSSEGGLASFYELIQRAGSARRADRHREAVIDYGTAGELFITTLVKAVGERRGMDPARLENFLNGPFKDRAQKLCRLLDVSPNPKDPDSPLFYWWLHCYGQRNWIVHEGADSMSMLSEAARIGTVQMVVDFREAIRVDSEVAGLASMINWGRRVDETGGGSGSEPDPLPPPLG